MEEIESLNNEQNPGGKSINNDNEKSDLDDSEKISICGKKFNITRTQLIAISLLSLFYFISSSYYSLFAPFLPEQALKKDISLTQVGFIFGVFEFVLLILSPIFGKYVNHFCRHLSIFKY